MSVRKRAIRRYVVLPPLGLILRGASAARMSSLEDAKPAKIEALLNSLAIGRTSITDHARNWTSYATERGDDRSFSFKLEHSVESDGPKLVQAAPEAERALRAAGLKLLPITKYRISATVAPTRIAIDTLDASATRDLRTEIYGKLAGSGPLGRDVVVAVVDSGVDHRHPALRAAVTGGRCLVPGEDELDIGPCADPKGGHGTHVAGIVGARSKAFAGVAPECSIRSYRVFPKQNTERGAENYSLIQAIKLATDDGCDIINLSLSGVTAKDDGVRDAVNYAWSNGVLCVAAAGNGGRKPVAYPARHPNCIAVSALGREDLVPGEEHDSTFVANSPRSSVDGRIFLATFSNVGPQIDFGGPGVWIVSTLPGGEWGGMSGTSMAAPAISGFAAVVLSRHDSIRLMPRNEGRSEALYQALVTEAISNKFSSFDFEGYGVPQ